MKMARYCGVLLALILAVTCLYALVYSRSTREEASMSERPVIPSQPRIPVLYEDVDSREIPAVIPLNDEQRGYLIEVLSAMIRVIDGSSSLEEEEEIVFGAGRFYWPKNPDEPIRLSKSYVDGNFRMPGLAARVSRESESAPWTRFGLSVRPRNFPRGVYSMQLPSSFFHDFQLQKVVQEEREFQSIRNPVVFYFKHKRLNDISLKMEAREDVVTTSDSFPSSFYALQLLRESKQNRESP